METLRTDRAATGVSTAHVLEQPSPLLVLPSSHCSSASSTLLPQLEAGGAPTTPALLRGIGMALTKSAAHWLVSSPSSSTVAPPLMSRRRVIALASGIPPAALNGVPTPLGD